jgi:hypothetical protein
MIQRETISITGTIRLRDEKPEIEVVSAGQIEGLDSSDSSWGGIGRAVI